MNPISRSRLRGSASLLLLALAGCATNPVTGQRQLALITEAQEVQMGQEASVQVEQMIGLVDDPALQQYIQSIGARLAAGSERPHLPWSFRVVDDPTPNAFALPGGYIYITRGLMNLMDSEAELAAVLGHEIGHVTARHAVTQISRAQIAQLGLGVGSIFVPQLQTFGNVLGAGLQLLFLSYGRDAERQSDDLAFRYALSEGYDVNEMDDVFLSLQRIGEQAGQSPLPSWLATHPNPGERIEAAQERVAALESPPQGLRLGRAEYLARVDGLVYGANPRNGFFREGVFYHPDLRFRLSFPQGWRTQNLAQAVVGVSDQRDAVVELTLARQQGANQAAGAFINQQGVQQVQSSRETINGVPAIVTAFRAQTQQGIIRGWAAFLEHGGRTYQILAYSPESVFRRYDNLFRQVLGSFAGVTDPAVLNVQPRRVQIVQVAESVSLAEFNARYPSVIPIEELAIINQAVDANTRFPAGTRLKRVVEGG